MGKLLHAARDAVINAVIIIRKKPKPKAAGFFFSFGLPVTKPPKPAVAFIFSFGLTTLKIKHMPVAISITNEQKVPVKLTPVTATGKPAKLDGVPTWEVVSGSSTVVAAADGLSAELISSDDPGDTQFLVKADADLGAGFTEISDVITLTVLGAQAANLGLTVGEPVAKA